ncbi:MAG: penicillin-binding transpeptidase domain-containing protein [Deltaproteobacteria bacterium]|nr:penicillin-binding transpeptidase domain-containing protein [Deltaproteobacteria bacterium]MCX7953391.1 penicillin-binding transpeptidase domain-containing protein [Deltaproteobacteria bacterium]
MFNTLRYLLIFIALTCIMVVDASPKKKPSRVKKKAPAPVNYEHKYFIPLKTVPSGYAQFADLNENKLQSLPLAFFKERDHFYILDKLKNKVVLTIHPRVQGILEEEVSKVKAHTVALVVISPKDGKILGYAGKSVSVPNPVLHNNYKIASLFKIITAAAAVDFARIDPHFPVQFRGGFYELSYFNFYPNAVKDNRKMSLEEGLARSVNPVFARLAIQFLNEKLLMYYSDRFGFNWKFSGDFEVPVSRGYVPSDQYELARTAAGFGSIFLSPIHAALIISSIGNHGFMMAPKVVDRVITSRGDILYSFRPTVLSKTMAKESAYKLLRSMISTHTMGTAKNSFKGSNVSWLVSGKTGTLSIEDPKGLMLSYAGVFPVNDPQYSLAVFVVNSSNTSSKATAVARRVIEKILWK